jgi:hypothetical protein
MRAMLREATEVKESHGVIIDVLYYRKRESVYNRRDRVHESYEVHQVVPHLIAVAKSAHTHKKHRAKIERLPNH